MSIIIAKKLDKKIIIGSDSQTTRGWNKEIRVEPTKLVDLGDIVVGSAGLVKTSKLLHLYISQHKINKLNDEVDILKFLTDFEKWIRENTNDTGFSLTSNQFIFIKGNKIWKVEEGYLIEKVSDFCAIGSGYDKALIALELGHSVEETLRAVCKYDLYCSEPIKIIEKEFKKSIKKNIKDKKSKK